MSVHKHGDSGPGCAGSCCLKVTDLGVNFGSEEVLHNVSFHLHCGEIVALIGPNGAGKSSLFRTILGQIPHTGDIEFQRAGGDRTRPLIGYVPQSPSFDRGDPVSVFDFFSAAISKWPVFLPSPKKLREAYILAFGKAGRRLPPPAEAFNGIVNRRFVSVTSRIVWLLRRLYRDGRAEYQALFQSGERSELVATFLAVLELVKSGRVSISDDNRTVFLNKRREAGERR